jgi:hypothetical protein
MDPGAFTAEMTRSEPAQFPLDQWHQRCERLLIAVAQCDKQLRHVLLGWRRHINLFGLFEPFGLFGPFE